MTGLKCPKKVITTEESAVVECVYTCEAPISMVRCGPEKICLKEGEVVRATGRLEKLDEKCVRIKHGAGEGRLYLALPPGRHEVGDQVIEVHKISVDVEDEPVYGLTTNVKVSDVCPRCKEKLAGTAYGNPIEVFPNDAREVPVVVRGEGVEIEGERFDVPEPKSVRDVLKCDVSANKVLKGVPTRLKVKISLPQEAEGKLVLYGNEFELEFPFDGSLEVVPKSDGGYAEVAGERIELPLPRLEDPVEVLEARLEGDLKLKILAKEKGKLEIKANGVKEEVEVDEGINEVTIKLPERLFDGYASILLELKFYEFKKVEVVEGIVKGKMRVLGREGPFILAEEDGRKKRVSVERLLHEGVLVEGERPAEAWRKRFPMPLSSVHANEGKVAVAAADHGYAVEGETLKEVSGSSQMLDAFVSKEFYFVNKDGFVYIIDKGKRSVYVGEDTSKYVVVSDCVYACWVSCVKYCVEEVWKRELPSEAKGKPVEALGFLLIPSEGLLVVSEDDGRVRRTFGNMELLSVAFGGGFLAVGGKDFVALYKLELPKMKKVWLRRAKDVRSIAMLPDASAIAYVDGKEVKVVDHEGNEIVALRYEDEPVSIAWDGKLLVVGLLSGEVIAYKAREVVRTRRSGSEAPLPPTPRS